MEELSCVIAKEFLRALRTLDRSPEGISESDLVIEVPKQEEWGAYSSTLAMVLAKRMQMRPMDLARAMVDALKGSSVFSKVECVAPGFINVDLDDRVLREALINLLRSERPFGSSEPCGITVNVEYVSANPTGPLHIGHGRGAVFGDVLANLLEFLGYRVIKEYYINDAGRQVDILADSLQIRYRQALGETIDFPENCYPGEYLVELARDLVEARGDSLLALEPLEAREVFRESALAANMAKIKDDLHALGVVHDVFTTERAIREGFPKILERFREQDLVYFGRLPVPKGAGAQGQHTTDQDLLLFRTREFGDDLDRALTKGDGSLTYFAADVAYHADKLARGAERLFCVLGADHAGYVKRMRAVVSALSGGTIDLQMLLYQLVTLKRDGKPVKLSKRSGTIITLREVIDEVGKDAMRFMMLYRKNDAVLDFDLNRVIEQSKDNPVFYVQYAHARACSVLGFAQADLGIQIEERLNALKVEDLKGLESVDERALVNMVLRFPQIVRSAGQSYEPHRLAFYLYDLATAFHRLWNRGKTDETLRFVNQNNAKLSLAKLCMVLATQRVLATGLGILGVSAPQEMR